MRLFRHDETNPAMGALGGLDLPSRARAPQLGNSKTVLDLMRAAPTVPAELPLEAVLQVMSEEDVRTVLVVNEQEDLIGTVREEDAERIIEDAPPLDPELVELRELVGDGFQLESALTAADVMEPYVQVVRPGWPAERAMALMKAEGVEALPVVVEGDSQAIGMICLSDLETVCAGRAIVAPREPHGTYRDVLRLPTMHGEQDRHSLIELADHIARSWLLSRPVERDDPSAVTFAEVMLPVLSDLYDDLVEHYSDFQEAELLGELLEDHPELSDKADRLRLRQGDALALISGLLGRVRHERRPDKGCLRRIRELTEELKSIEEAESDLVYSAHYVDVGALD